MEALIRPMQPGEHLACGEILRSLPDWFGMEEAIVQYVIDLQRMETWVVTIDEQPAGFITIHRHNEFSAEIHILALLREHHAHGHGRRLVEYVERILRAGSTEFLQVKTLGPSKPDAFYELTRGFYERMGFRQLEENNLWGDFNPCLIMVKHLGEPSS